MLIYSDVFIFCVFYRLRSLFRVLPALLLRPIFDIVCQVAFLSTTNWTILLLRDKLDLLSYLEPKINHVKIQNVIRIGWTVIKRNDLPQSTNQFDMRQGLNTELKYSFACENIIETLNDRTDCIAIRQSCYCSGIKTWTDSTVFSAKTKISRVHVIKSNQNISKNIKWTQNNIYRSRLCQTKESVP